MIKSVNFYCLQMHNTANPSTSSSPAYAYKFETSHSSTKHLEGHIFHKGTNGLKRTEQTEKKEKRKKLVIFLFLVIFGQFLLSGSLKHSCSNWDKFSGLHTALQISLLIINTEIVEHRCGKYTICICMWYIHHSIMIFSTPNQYLISISLSLFQLMTHGPYPEWQGKSLFSPL